MAEDRKADAVKSKSDEGVWALALILLIGGVIYYSKQQEQGPGPGPGPVPVPLEKFILGKWEHQFGPWKLEFQPGGQLRLWPPLGGPVAGTYTLDGDGALTIETAGGGKVRALASKNADGDLLLVKKESNVQMFGSDGRAIFIRSRASGG